MRIGLNRAKCPPKGGALERMVLGCSLLLLAAATLTSSEKAGSEIVLHCLSAATAPNLTMLRWAADDQDLVEWSRGAANDKWFIDDKNKLQRFELLHDTLALHISASTLEDSGRYVCSGYQEVHGGVNDTSLDEPLFTDVTIVTVRERPRTPREPPVVTVLDAYSLNVTWAHSVPETNRPIEEYLVYTRGEDQTKGHQAATVPYPQNATQIRGLQPFTKYRVYVTARNDVNESSPSPVSELVTTHQAAGDEILFTMTNVSSASSAPSLAAKPRITRFENYTTAIYVEFKPPPQHTLNGKLAGYLLKIRNQETTDSKVRPLYEPNRTNYNFTNLKPYTVYLISIQIFNDEAEGPEVERAVRTDEDVPGMPRIIQVKLHTYSSVFVVWEPPEDRNGVLLGYRLFWFKKDMEEIEWNVTLGNVHMYNITNLETYQEYHLQVAARTSRGYGERSSPPAMGVTDVKGPSAPVILNITRESATSIIVEWKRPEVKHRTIDQYRIVYRPVGVEGADGGGSGLEQVRIKSSSQDPQQESTESEVIDKLTINTKFMIRIAGETKSIFSDRYYTGEYSEPMTINLTTDLVPSGPPSRRSRDSLVAGVLAGILVTAFILFIAGMVCLALRKYMKRSYQFIANPTSNNVTDNTITLPESYAIKRPVIEKNDTEPITVEAWADHVTNLHADTDLRFSQEYEEINRNVRTDLTFDHSADPENKHKNRYTNIIAYDHSRVILKQLPNKPRQSDYINANYVDGYHKPKAYIATQGPLPATFADFWRMVWEQNSLVICMITNLTERGRRKCDQYWPNDGEQTYGQLSVKLLNTYKMAHYTVRVFTLKNLKVKRKSASERLLGAGPQQKGAAERLVFQYHYTDWPDHGVPDFTLPVLMYVRKSAAAAGDDAGPIIIHCSAGVGRTGTYIVLDSMMRQIKDKGTLNVYGFLSHIRNQRNYLVQTEDQYIFIHDALLEFIQSGGDTEVKDSNITKYCEDLLLQSGPNKETLLEQQFKLVTSFQPCDFHLTSAMLPANLMKNRSKQILPVELSRVRLPAQPGEEGSDYINASFQQGYNRNEEYILTQHPLKATIVDFWRMVWDRNSMTVVLLSQTDTEEYLEFWPAKGETMDCGNFKVTFTEEEQHPNYYTRDFLLQSTQDDYECTMRMMSTSYWPDSCTPLSGAFDLVQTVKAWHQEQQQNEGPIIVVDKFGGTEAATFSALSTIHDQLHQEGCIDIYMVAKLYHLKRPGIFTRLEDYHLLYKALESVCDSTPAGDRDSGISNCANYPATMPTHFSDQNDMELTKIQRAETTM